jgi:hypothetical protein
MLHGVACNIMTSGGTYDTVPTFEHAAVSPSPFEKPKSQSCVHACACACVSGLHHTPYDPYDIRSYDHLEGISQPYEPRMSPIRSKRHTPCGARRMAYGATLVCACACVRVCASLSAGAREGLGYGLLLALQTSLSAPPRACAERSYLLCTFSAPTRHLLGTYSAPSRHLLGTFSAPSRHLLGTFSAPTLHRLGTYSAPTFRIGCGSPSSCCNTQFSGFTSLTPDTAPSLRPTLPRTYL